MADILLTAQSPNDIVQYVQQSVLKIKQVRAIENIGIGVYPENYGAVGDGLTNDSAAIRSALTVAKNLNIPLLFDAKTYYCGSISQTVLTCDSTVRIIGAGIEKTILKFDVTSADFMTVSADNVFISNLSIDGYQLTPSYVSIRFNGSCDNFCAEKIRITGLRSLSGGNYIMHGITLNTTVNVTNASFYNCYFEDIRSVLFTANSYAGLSKDWIFVGCKFIRYSNEITFNTDYATSSVINAWDGITFVSCLFDTKTNSGWGAYANMFVSYDGAKKINILGCTFKNATDSSGIGNGAIHFESFGGQCIVNGNTFENVSSGIQVFPSSTTGYVGNYPLSGNIIISNNVLIGEYTNRSNSSTVSAFPSSTAGQRYGIWLLNNSDGEPDNVIVTNNVICAFDIGIACGGKQRGQVVKNNEINLCSDGLAINAGNFASDISGNVIKLCLNAYNSYSSNGFIGKNKIIDCVNLRTGSSMHITGLELHNSVGGSTTASTTKQIALFPISSSFRLATSVYIRFVSAFINSAKTTCNYDGTTLTATRDFDFLSGSDRIASAPFTISGGILYFNATIGASGNNSTSTLEVIFDGYMYLA